MNDVTVFNGKAPSAAFASLNPQSESLSDGIGGGFGVIHYTGKNWSLRLRNETYNFTRSDDGTPLAYIDAIILRQLPVRSKTFYLKGAYERGEIGPPLCASLDGITPDLGVKEPQATACALCPRNVVKLNSEGRMGRECRDNKRLALLLTPTLSKSILKEPLMEPVLLRVPAASLTALARMGDDMASKGWHYSSFVTRIGFVAEKPYPELTFRALVELTDKEAPIVLPLREDAMAYRITGESELNKPRQPQIATEPPQQGAQLTAPAQQAAQTPKRTTPPPVTLDLQAKAVEVSFDQTSGVEGGRMNANVTQRARGAPVDNGFGSVATFANGRDHDAPPAPKPPMPGDTEDASADLDAQVEALLKSS